MEKNGENRIVSVVAIIKVSQIKDNNYQFNSNRISMIHFAVCFYHYTKKNIIRKILLLITMCLGLVTVCFAQSDYNAKKAQGYQRDAECYQKKAESYRSEVTYYLKKAVIWPQKFGRIIK